MMKTAIALGVLVAAAGAGWAYHEDIQNQLIVRGVMSCPAGSDKRTVSDVAGAKMKVGDHRELDICDGERGWHKMYISVSAAWLPAERDKQ